MYKNMLCSRFLRAKEDDFTDFFFFFFLRADWSANMEIPWDIKMAYLVQGSYYLHGLATVLVIDVWRSDSMVLCMHHILTLILITLSYTCR